MNSKSLYRDANINYHVIVGLMALVMIGLSIYLTNHYFEVKFPTGLEPSGLCNINSFFNCDVATSSPASNIMGVPISLFGIIIGAFILVGFMVKTDAFEGTIHTVMIINAVGCLALFIYSLIALGGLCPACTGYYIASWIVLYCLYKTSTLKAFDLKAVAGYGITIAAAFAITYNVVQKKESAVNQIADSLVAQYKSLENLGNPNFESPYRMASATQKFADAPIRISKFSDFECPACKMLSEVLHEVAEKYKGKVNIQYFFYPLDNACNPDMQRPLHRFACKAAKLATCMPEKFSSYEKDVFANQTALSDDWLTSYANKQGVSTCYESDSAKEQIESHMKEAKRFGVQSTPTFLLNGVKIEGVLPMAQLSILIDHLLKNE